MWIGEPCMVNECEIFTWPPRKIGFGYNSRGLGLESGASVRSSFRFSTGRKIDSMRKPSNDRPCSYQFTVHGECTQKRMTVGVPCFPHLTKGTTATTSQPPPIQATPTHQLHFQPHALDIVTTAIDAPTDHYHHHHH